MSGVDVHRVLAVAVALAGVVLAVVTVGWARLGRPGRLAVDRAILAGLVGVVAAIASGVVLILTGLRPADGLHLLYAGAALLILPVVRFGALFAGRRAAALVVGAAVLVALVVRLAQTG
jgi:hypothetical protein